MPYFFGTSLVALKQGAVELLESDVQVPYLGCLHIPVLSYWNYGKGRSVAHAPDWTPKGGELLMLWEYYPDYVANIVFLATQNHIPEDVGLVHDLRIAFRLLDADVASVFDLVGFVEMFGAETRSLQEDLIKLKERASGAEGLYVGNDYEGALEAISETEGEVTRLLRGALRLKNRTMIWIYLVEWLVITGAALVTGSVVWEIMVRRRLYRAVESTRQAPRL
jgi:hypothetical protein